MTMNKKLIVLASAISTALMGLPMVACAAYSSGALPSTLSNLSLDGIILAILGIIWPIFMGFAVIMFFIAGFDLLSSKGDPKGVADARNAIIWGVAGVAVGLLALTIPVIVRNAIGV